MQKLLIYVSLPQLPCEDKVPKQLTFQSAPLPGSETSLSTFGFKHLYMDIDQ